MEDIAPSLLKRIQEDYQENFDKSKLISQLYEKVRDGTATYKEANDFALEAGEILANAYKNNLSADVFIFHHSFPFSIIPPIVIGRFKVDTILMQKPFSVLKEKVKY